MPSFQNTRKTAPLVVFTEHYVYYYVFQIIQSPGP